MSYCEKIKAEKIYKMAETELNKTLDTCENCLKYSQCDTVALMQDELKVKQGELLKCPHCENYLEHANCPDLFCVEETQQLKEQEALLREVQALGYNIVTCGNCGQVFIHKL